MDDHGGRAHDAGREEDDAVPNGTSVRTATATDASETLPLPPLSTVDEPAEHFCKTIYRELDVVDASFGDAGGDRATVYLLVGTESQFAQAENDIRAWHADLKTRVTSPPCEIHRLVM